MGSRLGAIYSIGPVSPSGELSNADDGIGWTWPPRLPDRLSFVMGATLVSLHVRLGDGLALVGAPNGFTEKGSQRRRCALLSHVHARRAARAAADAAAALASAAVVAARSAARHLSRRRCGHRRRRRRVHRCRLDRLHVQPLPMRRANKRSSGARGLRRTGASRSLRLAWGRDGGGCRKPSASRSSGRRLPSLTAMGAARSRPRRLAT